MARIPKLKSSRISLDVPRMPTQDIQNAGMVSKAQGALAGQAQNLGMAIAKKRIVAERNESEDDSMSKITSAISSITNEEQEKLLKDPNAFTSKTTEELISPAMERYKKVINESIENAYDGAASHAIRSKSMNMLNRQKINLESIVNKQKSDVRKSNIELRAGTVAVEAEVTGELNTVLDSYAQSSLEIQTNQDMTPTEKINNQAALTRDTTEGLLGGKVRNGDFKGAQQLLLDDPLGAFEGKNGLRLKQKLQNKILAQQKLQDAEEERALVKEEKAIKRERENNLDELFAAKARGEDISGRATQMMADKKIGYKQFNILDQKIMNEEQKDIQNDRLLYYDNLDEEIPLDAKIESINSDIDLGLIGYDKGRAKIKELERREARGERIAAKNSKKQIALAVKSSKEYGFSKSLSNSKILEIQAKAAVYLEDGKNWQEATDQALVDIMGHPETILNRMPPALQKDLTVTYGKAKATLKHKMNLITDRQSPKGKAMLREILLEMDALDAKYEQQLRDKRLQSIQK